MEPTKTTWSSFYKDLKAATCDQEVDAAVRKWTEVAYRGRWVGYFKKYGTIVISGIRADLKPKEYNNGI